MKQTKKIVLIILSIIVTVITIITLLIFHGNNVKANSCNLPTETAKLISKSYYNLFDNTKIDWFDWGFDAPIYKVKEFNPYNDYWIINDSQTVIADLWACIDTENQKIYVNDKSKIPEDYHSDKISSVSLAYYDIGKEVSKRIYLDLSADEILLLEQIVFASTDEWEINDNFSFNQVDLYMNGDNPTIWDVRFYIKDLDGLYYSGSPLIKSTDGTYYISYGYNKVSKIPTEIGVKFDKAFQEQLVEFQE